MSPRRRPARRRASSSWARTPTSRSRSTLHLERAGCAALSPRPARPSSSRSCGRSPRTLLVLVLPASPDATWGSGAHRGARRRPLRRARGHGGALARGGRAARRGGRRRARPLARRGARPAVRCSCDAAPARPVPVRPIRRAPGAGHPPAAAGAGPRRLPPRRAPRRRSLAEADEPPPRAPASPSPDLMALIDEELVEEPGAARRPPTRVEVNGQPGVGAQLLRGHHPPHRLGRRLHRHRHAARRWGRASRCGSGWPTAASSTSRARWPSCGRSSATTGRQPAGCGVRLHGLPGWAGGRDRPLLPGAPAHRLTRRWTRGGRGAARRRHPTRRPPGRSAARPAGRAR